MSKYIFILCLCCVAALQAQEPPKLRWTIEKPNAQYIIADKLNFLYVVSDNSIEKYSEQGALIGTYRENNLGAIHSVDVSNPFQLLVFFDEYSKAVLLDRTLSETSRFSLQDIAGGIFVQSVGLSSDNHLWLYNTEVFELQKIDQNGKVLRSSLDLSLLLLNLEFQPRRITEHDNLIFLHDPITGIAIFDVLGNFVRFVELPNQKRIHFFQHYIVYLQQKELKTYHVGRREIQIEKIPSFLPEEYDDIIIGQKRIWTQKNGIICYFTLN
jgi:hypothetical protein